MTIPNKVMIQDNPSIGIVTPTHNRNKLLGRFLKQIKRQSYDNWYLAIVHDGANQEAQKLIEKFAGNDKKITYSCTQDHSNDYGTTPRLEGAKYLFKEKNVQYLVFWDDDNSFHQNALNVITQAIVANDYPKLLLSPFRHKNFILPTPNIPIESIHAGQIDSANFVVRSDIALDYLCQVKQIVDKNRQKAYVSDYLFFFILRDNLLLSEIKNIQALPIGVHDGLRYFQAMRWKLGIDDLGLGKYLWYKKLKSFFYEWL